MICLWNPPLPVGFIPPPSEDDAFNRLVGLVGVRPPNQLSVLRQGYWGSRGVNLTVSFMDNPPVAVRDKILLYANGWGKHANVKFRWTQSGGQVRIMRESRGGYWSYLGRDILGIPLSQATMNLANFTMNTPEREWSRVVPHEFGHTLGFPHEHTRKEIVDNIDRQAAYAYFRQTSGWTQRMVDEQVLKPLSAQAIMSTSRAMPDSIMCYELPAQIMKDRKPVVGGAAISLVDHDFCRKLYPMAL